jgi:hypothetical protein
METENWHFNSIQNLGIWKDFWEKEINDYERIAVSEEGIVVIHDDLILLSSILCVGLSENFKI